MVLSKQIPVVHCNTPESLSYDENGYQVLSLSCRISLVLAGIPGKGSIFDFKDFHQALESTFRIPKRCTSDTFDVLLSRCITFHPFFGSNSVTPSPVLYLVSCTRRLRSFSVACGRFPSPPPRTYELRIWLDSSAHLG